MADPQDAQTPDTPDPIYPLGLPKGSVRALTALMIFFTAGYLIFSEKAPVPAELNSALILCLSYYFASRQRSGHGDPGKKVSQPLGLPKGSIRFIFILSFGALIFFVLKRHGYKISNIPETHLATMAMVGGFLLGNLLRPLLDGILKVTSERATFVVLLAHLRGMIALSVTAVYVLGVIFDWLPTELETEKFLPEVFPLIFLSVIGFYLGNRN